MKKVIVLMVMVMMLIFTVSTIGEAWEPTEMIELVVHNDAGSGTDQFARTIAHIITQYGLVDKEVRVTNRAGGSGFIAREYILAQEGNPHIIHSVSNNHLMRPIINPDDYDYNYFTTYANMMLNIYMVSVSTSSPYETFQDLIDATRELPPFTLSHGFGAVGTPAWITGRLIEKEAEILWNPISFGVSGEAIISTLGGHIDILCEPPIQVVEHIRAGTLRPLAVTSEDRSDVDILADVPTLVELGYDIVVGAPAGIWGPPGVSEEAIAFWEEVLEFIVDTPEFEEYMQMADSEKYFLTGDAYQSFLERSMGDYRDLMEDLED